MTQLSYSQNPPIGRAGMLADGRVMKHIQSRLMAGRGRAGFGVFKLAVIGNPGSESFDPGQVYQNPSPAAVLDVDAITATCTSATGTFLAASADGVHGDDVMYPPRKLTITFNASTDWDATTGSIAYLDHNGVLQTESVAIATSTAIETTGYASQFVSFTKPAQTGAGGNCTIGVAVLDSSVVIADFAGVLRYDASVPPYDTTTSNACEYGDGATVDVIERGAVVVNPETACVPTDPVYVRIVASGANTQIGAFRNDADSATAVLVTGAKWERANEAAAPNHLSLP